MSVLLTFAADTAAHGGTEHADVMALNWLPGVTTLVVFLIVLGVLSVTVWPKIIGALDERNNKIRQEIASAEEARAQAKAALAEYQENLASAREEANQMIVKARADAKATAEELRSRNEAELTEMKQRATREIESAKQAAITSLYSEASSLAVTIAGKILQREINEDDQRNLVDDSLRELAEAGKG